MRLPDNVIDAVADWLGNGEVGLSSKCMALTLGLGRTPKRLDHPHDPDDLRRCLLLLDAVPELRDRVPHMGRLGSPVWERLAGAWGELETLFYRECGNPKTARGQAPLLYARMREIIDEGRRDGD